MNYELSDLVNKIQPSGIRRFFDLASSMDNVISLGVGEPDFVTPYSFREACIQALEDGYTAYTANAGLLQLREAISEYLNTNFQTAYNPINQLIVTVGGSQALDVALRAILNPGDEVIVVEPNFVAYGALITLAGGTPVYVSTKGEFGFKLQAEELKAAITEKTKAIILCSPNNPTGTLLSSTDLQEICDIIIENNLYVISDEIYAELDYDREFISLAAMPGMYERTIVVNGFSKGFAMTGWRLGYLAGPEPLISAMLKIHQYSMMCAPTMSQFAALEALTTGRKEVEKMVKSYRQRRNLFVSMLNEIGLECHIPGGAFYAFPNITSTGMSSEEFAEKLLREERVAVVPGSVFGPSGEGYVRCSYASSLDSLQEALRRMRDFVERHVENQQKTTNA
ncbi:MAG: aminotransferase [Bacilli bacterium]